MNTNLLSYFKHSYLFLDYVKMSSTWGQSAWFKSFQFKPSETKRSAFYSVFTQKTNPQETFHK